VLESTYIVSNKMLGRAFYSQILMDKMDKNSYHLPDIWVM